MNRQERNILLSPDRLDNLISAVDIVCMECAYLSDETCDKCPVRMTMSRIKMEGDYNNGKD